MKKAEALMYRAKIEQAAENLEDKTALDSIELFPSWASGKNVTVGHRLQYDGVLYRVLQSHTTQDNWTPDITPALFAVVSIEEWPEWIQPTSAETAYKIGDKVTFENKHYVSLIDNNVWSPAAYPGAWEEKP